jgi:2,3-bisphosphoglycerate-dependent phosphoglycerate mutase
MSTKAILIIVRHGQSVWNLENRFTGEVDVALTKQGEEEAKNAGLLLRPYIIDEAFTSVLQRAIRSLEIILSQIDNRNMPVTENAALNERNYGELQGLNKKETAGRYGADQVLAWRRSFDVAPPGGESLKDTFNRVIPYYKKEIVPRLELGKNILVVAHGNSLRALMMHLENISPEEIPSIDLATGVPKLYELDGTLAVTRSFYLR